MIAMCLDTMRRLARDENRKDEKERSILIDRGVGLVLELSWLFWQMLLASKILTC